MIKRLLVVLSIGFLFIVGQNPAQGFETCGPDCQSTGSLDNFTESELERFAKAEVKIEKYQEEKAQQKKRAKDGWEKEQIGNKYKERKRQRLRRVGLREQKYNEITQAVANDFELKEKVSNLKYHFR